jgi:hypothetical protein
MADERQYNESGEVVSGYLSPDEAREMGVAWAGRPNEPAPYRTEDESREEGTAYVSEAQHKINVGGNYDYYKNIDGPARALASSITTLGATEGARQTPTVGPVGLAYPDDPINYATMQYNPASGYNGLQSGIYPTGAAPALGAAPAAAGGMLGGMSQTTVLLLLGAAAVAGYVLLVKS